MELRKTDLLWFKLLYLDAALIVVARVMGMGHVSSALFLLTFPLTVALWALSVRKTVTGVDLLMLGTAATAFANVLLNASITHMDLSFDYLRKVIMFIMTLLFFQTAYRFRASEELERFIHILLDILTGFLIVMFLAKGPAMYVMNDRVTPYLTFRFSNPNQTGLFLIGIYMLQMYRLFSPGRWYTKLLHVVMELFLAFFIIATRSRNCLLVLVLFSVSCFWLILRSRRRLRINGFWAAVIAVTPAAFVAGYVLLVYSPWIQKTFAFLVSEGKDLNSRMDIWVPALEALMEYPLLGAYSQLSRGTGAFQLHNTHLDIAGSYGIPVLVLVCILLTNYLYQRGRYYSDKGDYTYILGFACALLLGIGEATLFSGGLGIYIYIGTFLLLASKERTV